jgi:hypothetical protein
LAARVSPAAPASFLPQQVAARAPAVMVVNRSFFQMRMLA